MCGAMGIRRPDDAVDFEMNEFYALCLTLDYMDIGPYYLPETSTVHVEISPLRRGFIWKFRCIIAQAGIV
jgi:hypothetical protein